MIGGRTVDVRTVVASSSPFILNATLNKHLNQYNDPVGKDVRKNIYVEDLISGVQHEEEAATYYNRARTLMSPVDFNLRSWTSNNPVIQSLAAKEYLLCDRPETKVLGVLWNTTTDMINYPPMRFTASTIPNLINKGNVAWDDPLIPDLQMKLKELATEFETIMSIATSQ